MKSDVNKVLAYLKSGNKLTFNGAKAMGLTHDLELVIMNINRRCAGMKLDYRIVQDKVRSVVEYRLRRYED